MQTELKSTALAARLWRKDHSGPMADMPVDLQQKVVRLLDAHSWDEVCEATGISRSSLSVIRRRHRDELQTAPRSRSRRRTRTHKKSAPRKTRKPRKVEGTSFIELPIPGAAPRLDVEVRLLSGVVVHARSGNDAIAVGEFVARLLAGMPGAA